MGYELLQVLETVLPYKVNTTVILYLFAVVWMKDTAQDGTRNNLRFAELLIPVGSFASRIVNQPFVRIHTRI